MDAPGFVDAFLSGQVGLNAFLPASLSLVSLPLYRKWLIFVLMMALIGEIWATLKDTFTSSCPDLPHFLMCLPGFVFFFLVACVMLWLLWKTLKFVWWLLFKILCGVFSCLTTHSQDEGKSPILQSVRPPLPPEDLWAKSKEPEPMKWNRAARGPMYYFFDFYISARDWDDTTTRVEQHFNEEVNRFKDWGNETMWFSYLQAIRSLGRDDVLVIFMPCSSRARYLKRWQGLATYLHEYGMEVGINMLEITETREIAHFNMQADRRIVRNYKLHIPEGRICVILDDVRTTGNSCEDLAEAIREQGSYAIGAIVMAQVPRYYPSGKY